MAMTRARKVLLSLAVLVLLLGGAGVVVPPLLWGDGVDYSQVVSIAGAPEYQDPALLARAWALPVAARYRAGLDYQRNGSFCGPTSVVNVARSLGGTADQGTVLEGSDISSIFGILPGGITLDQLGALAGRRLGRRITALRDLDRQAFREHLRRSNDPARRYIVNFHRGPLFGKGGGHHSPVAGYLEDRDLVLVLDVNAKFKPWLVKADRLYDAMNTVDRSSGKKRGLLLIE